MSSTISESFNKDPRIAEAKKLIGEALKDHQKKITGTRPPDPHLKISYEELLQSMYDARGAKLYFPYLGSGFGNGALVELLDGSIKYDFICNIGPHYWGHSHPEIVNAAIDAALSDTIMQGNLQQNADALEMCRLLIKASKLEHCLLSTSGATANENGLKIAFQKKFPANRILAFERCFMGRTLALSQITDKAAFREGLPINYGVDYIPFYQASRPEESTREAVATLRKFIERYPKQYAVMCMELVQGEGGLWTAPREFFVALLDVLKENGIAVMFDEIQTFGRTPQLFAYQHFKLDEYADIVTLGKLSQVCATLFKKDFAPRPGLLSQTFTGSTSAIQAGITIISNLLNEGYFGPDGKIEKTHQYFSQKLAELEKKHPTLIHGPFGIGTMMAFTPFDGENKRVTTFIQNLFQAGVISFFAGTQPTRVRFLLPVGALKQEDIDKATEIIEKTLLSS